jgi:hypothetical protein
MTKYSMTKYLAVLLMVVCSGCVANASATPVMASMKPDMVMRTYNIGPLIESLALQHKAIRSAGSKAWEFNPEWAIQSTIDVIRNGVDPTSWGYVSGTELSSKGNSTARGRIDRIATLLVVTTTPENQAAVHRLLDEMRRAAGPPRDRMQMRRRMMMRIREFLNRMRNQRAMPGRDGMRGQGRMPGPDGMRGQGRMPGPDGMRGQGRGGPMNQQPMHPGLQRDGQPGMQPGMQGPMHRKMRPSTQPTTRPWRHDGRPSQAPPPPPTGSSGQN